MTRLAAAALVVAAAQGCAQPRAPTGGEPDRTPPRVIDVSPAQLSTITDLSAPVVIRFDERLSERMEGVRSPRDAVIVSPETGPYRVRRGRRELEITMPGGWRPGVVYRIVVLPVFRDLFNNARTEPIELVFSTGAPIPETALAGFVEQRLEGVPAPGARVEATRRLDTLRYVAVTDTGGFFALRHIPAGAYDLLAWLDRDRDRSPDLIEPQDTEEAVIGFQDTVVLELAVLPQDTTPARLARAEVLDSIRLRLLFDDYFAPGAVDGHGVVYLEADSSFVTEARLLHATALDSIRARDRAVADSLRALEAALRAAADTLRPDTLAADTVGADTVRADTVRPVIQRPPEGPPRQPGQPPPGQPGRPGQAVPGQPGAPPAGPPPRRLLPSQELIAELALPLEAATTYYIVVRDVTNIRGMPGGGGTARFRTLAAPDTTVAPDSVPPPGGGR